MCRVAGKALHERGLQQAEQLRIFCMHDAPADADDNLYFPWEIFRGFGGRKKQFILAAVMAGKKADTVILSHINLLLVGWLIRKISPSTKLVLFAHGIEIWDPLGPLRMKWLNSCDTIISVSRFTSGKIQEVHGIPPARCRVLNNCLDPFLPLPSGHRTNTQLRDKYGYTEAHQVLFTLSRLSSKERYKGYDKVLEAMVSIKDKFPGLRYLLAGSYDEEEERYLRQLIEELGLKQYVTITGYLPEEELAPHFELADIYVMPSRKEGFGIVFIEAMYYGLPVIAGNIDGSVDALLDGKLGLLVNPLSVEEIKAALEKMLENKNAFLPDRELLKEHFGYEAYKEKMDKVLLS